MADVDIRQEPAEVNLVLTRGDNWTRLFRFSIDLTGYTFSCKTADGDTITVTDTDLASGEITLSMSSTITAELTNGVGWYLDWTISGRLRRVFAGIITV